MAASAGAGEVLAVALVVIGAITVGSPAAGAVVGEAGVGGKTDGCAGEAGVAGAEAAVDAPARAVGSVRDAGVASPITGAVEDAALHPASPKSGSNGSRSTTRSTIRFVSGA